MSTLLKNIVDLSHEFGTPDFVKGGGGNTSAKNAGTLWIKPSGTTLAGLQENDFVAVDRKALPALYVMDVPPDAAVREARVKDLMMAAVCGGSRGRPSVETPLHDIFRATYVVHTHAVLVNGMTCGRRGRTEAARLFPDALWLPYIDPGFTLSMAVRTAVAGYEQKHGRQPDTILLENHGIFVAGDTPDEIRAAYRRVLDALAGHYAGHGLSTQLTRSAAVSSRDADVLAGWPGVGSVVAGGRFAAVRGPLTPDHMVYAKAYPYDQPLTAADRDTFVARHGYAPRVVITPNGVYGIGKNEAQARLALELSLDGALIGQLAEGFGGLQLMSENARLFIESWEVESYREQMLSKPKMVSGQGRGGVPDN
jgi:rhamnose utilization protein RhaD (predicted bifunctional aldolase and dehydrogenase)